MIYIENKDGVQRVVIPTNDTNVEYVNFVPQEGDSDYYTKEQTDEKISQSSTAVLGEVGDWLSHYATTDYVHDAVENVTVDLTGYATEDYVDAEIQKIPKPDMSDYYTKEETDDKIDKALLDAPLMLEHAGFATQNWVKDQNYTTDEWVLQQRYATEDYVDDAVANIPTGGGVDPFIVKVANITPMTKTVFDQLFESYSNGVPTYLHKTDTGQLSPVVGIQGTITGGLLSIASMWVIDKTNLIEFIRTSSTGTNTTYVTIPLGGSGGSTDMSDYYTKGEVDTVKDDLQGQITDNNNAINDNKNAIKDLDSRVEKIELNGGSGGGSATVDWDNVPYLTVNGFAVFNREVQFEAGGDNTDISSGIECAFKTGRSQSVNQWTRFIHAGTDGDNIYFVDADGYNQLAMIDTAGNIYEGTEMLSDKYATKAYVDDLIININNTLSKI